jgi:uncharacterized protein (TIGR03083 family)
MTLLAAAYRQVLRENGEAIVHLARGRLDQPVPSCPGWSVRSLLGHLGGLYARTVAQLPTGSLDAPQPPPAPPTGDADLLDYFDENLAALLLTLDAVDPDRPAWNFFPHTRQVAGFWRRRLAHETAVHRVDVELAAGAEPLVAAAAISPPAAADGVDELLAVYLPRRRRVAAAGDQAAADPTGRLDGSVHIHLADTPGEWLVRLHGADVETTHGHAKGDAVLRGPAVPVLLAFWGRLPLEAPEVDVIGDPDLVRAVGPGL